MTKTANKKYAKGGSDAYVIHVYGDKTTQLEPTEHRIHFPGGYIGVTRTTKNEYWVHIGVHTSFDGCEENLPGRLVDARIDLLDKPTHEADLGDLNNSNLEHLAILVKVADDFLREPGRTFEHIVTKKKQLF